MAIPIWKDKEVTLGSGASYDFEIRLGSSSGAAIYAGRAYKRPGASSHSGVPSLQHPYR